MGKKRGTLGLIMGLAAGALAGLLFAPRKGKELREKIKKERAAGGLGEEALKEDFAAMGREILREIKKLAEMEEVQTVWRKGKDKVLEFAEERKEELDILLQRVQKKAEEFKEMMKDLGEEKKVELEAHLKKKIDQVKKKVSEAKRKINQKTRGLKKEKTGRTKRKTSSKKPFKSA